MIAAALAAGCAKEADVPEAPKAPETLSGSTSAVPGLVRIQVSEALADELLAAYVAFVKTVSLEGIDSFLLPVNLDAHVLKQQNQVLHVQNLRHVADFNLIPREQYRAYDLKSLIFRPLRHYGSAEFVASFYNKRTHIL